MKKIFFILTTLMTIFGMTNVYAESCTHAYSTSLNSLVSQTSTLSSGKNTINHNLSSNISIPNGISNFDGKLWWVINDTSKNFSSNINLTETCNRYTSADIGGYTITYADGTHASISPDSYGTMCNQWTTTGTQTITQIYQPNITTISLRYVSTRGQTGYCKVDSNGNYSCPVIHEDLQIMRFTFVFALSNSSSSSVSYGFVSNEYNLCINDTQQIINNNNQNTQDTINTITDSNINSSVTTDTNNIGNSVNTEGKNVVLNFLMIPFTFMTNVVNSFDNQCQSVCLGNCPSGGGGHDNAFYFVLPCINLQQILGNTVYGLIDALMCVTMIFAFIRSVIKFIQKCLLLEVDVSSEVRMFS